MSQESSTWLKIPLWGIGLVVILSLPLILFKTKPVEGIEKRTDGEVSKKKLFLSTAEGASEDPRVMYEPDLRQGFSNWLLKDLALPPLDRPDLKMGSPNFYTEEEFPEPLNSPQISLDQKLRNDWPLPFLRHEKTYQEAGLKTLKPGFIILADGVEKEDLISQEEFLRALKDLAAGAIKNMTIMAISINQKGAEVTLIKSCGWRPLDNLLGQKVFEHYNKEIIRESILTGAEIEWASNELKYIAEWRTGLTKPKK